jgi:hypothetical protein
MGVVSLSHGQITTTKPFVWPPAPDGAQKSHKWLEAKKHELRTGEYFFALHVVALRMSSFPSQPPANPRGGPAESREKDVSTVGIPHRSQSETLAGAVFLLKEAIRLTGFGGHPRTIRHHLGRVKDLVCEEDDIWEDVMILFDCLKYLNDMYP